MKSFCLLASFAVALPALAQAPDGGADRRAISGRVIDLASSEPLFGASVVLEPRPDGVIMGGVRASAYVRASRSTVTDDKGVYNFDGISDGSYRLFVRRLGYAPSVLEVEVSGAALSRVSVGMTMAPIPLRKIDSENSPSEPFNRHSPSRIDSKWDRVTLEQYRQALLLTSDSRSLTYDDLRESASFAESDLYRALRQIPSVGFRDDKSSEFRVRGAPWHHTVTTFDGVPVLDATHVYGAFSAVNTDALGAAFLTPGGGSASASSGASGLLDLRSRPATTGFHGVGELFPFTARLATDGTVASDRVGFLIAGRRSHWDLLDALIDEDLGFLAHDVTGRLDVDLRSVGALTISGFTSQDRFQEFGTHRPISEQRSSWGSRLASIQHTYRIANTALTTSAGFSAFDADLGASWGVPTSNRVRYHQVGQELRPVGLTIRDGFSLGYQVSRTTVDYDGAAPRVRTFPADPFRRLAYRQARTDVSMWAETRQAISRDVILQVGLRAETGDRVAESPSIRLAPRVIAKYTDADNNLSFSASFSRSFQYRRVVGPSNNTVADSDGLYPSHVWNLASDSLPALRSSTITMGAERWLSGGWLASATVYQRSTDGLRMVSPEPGLVTSDEVTTPGREESIGLEVSARRTVGRTAATFAYSLSRTRIRSGSIEFASDNDRTHQFHMGVIRSMNRDLRLGAVLTLATGNPYTRYSTSTTGDLGDFAGLPNDLRSRSFSSLNLLLDWTHSYDDWDLGIYVQVVNALFRENEGVYEGDFNFLRPGGSVPRFDESIPILPVFGIRVAF